MGKHLAYITLFLLASCASCKSKAPAVSAGGQEVVIADSIRSGFVADTIELGRMKVGERVSKEIYIVNETAAPVVVVDMKTSCGCLSFQYGRQPITPGERKTVEFIFDSRGFYGEIDKTVYIHTSASRNPVEILVRADIQ